MSCNNNAGAVDFGLPNLHDQESCNYNNINQFRFERLISIKQSPAPASLGTQLDFLRAAKSQLEELGHAQAQSIARVRRACAHNLKRLRRTNTVLFEKRLLSHKQAIENDLSRKFKQNLLQAREELISIIIGVSEEIIGDKLAAQPELLIQRITAALALVEVSGVDRILVSNADHSLLSQELQRTFKKQTIAPCPELKPHCFKLQGEAGEILIDWRDYLRRMELRLKRKQIGEVADVC